MAKQAPIFRVKKTILGRIGKNFSLITTDFFDARITKLKKPQVMQLAPNKLNKRTRKLLRAQFSRESRPLTTEEIDTALKLKKRMRKMDRKRRRYLRIHPPQGAGGSW